jgi:hypothetical protein
MEATEAWGATEAWAEAMEDTEEGWAAVLEEAIRVMGEEGIGATIVGLE